MFSQSDLLRRKTDDPEVQRLLDIDNDLLKSLGTGVLEDIVPYLKDIYPTAKWKKLVTLTTEMLNVIRKKLQEHKDTFNAGTSYT